jgi:hypothetical protein
MPQAAAIELSFGRYNLAAVSLTNQGPPISITSHVSDFKRTYLGRIGRRRPRAGPAASSAPSPVLAGIGSQT